MSGLGLGKGAVGCQNAAWFGTIVSPVSRTPFWTEVPFLPSALALVLDAVSVREWVKITFSADIMHTE